MADVQNVETLIKNIIKERGLQQKFICEKIKISQEQFSQCMRGKRRFNVIEFLALNRFYVKNFRKPGFLNVNL